MTEPHSTTWGATPEDWAHLDLVLGLGPDLLPVVSNPNAEVSPASKLKGIGKTPSLYNNERKVMGIAKWTELQATSNNIERWSKNPDYGICIQTRTVRAIDIDVECIESAGEIVAELRDYLDMTLPMRWRENSGKCLLVFIMDGEFPKQVIQTDAGAIEFLANGQQFIAVGTHSSGVRYQWDGGLPFDIPVLTAEEFAGLWSHLSERYGNGASVTGSMTPRQRGEHVDMPDSMADWLRAQGRVLDEGRNGELHIACPWDDEHTSGSPGDGSTTYFPAGTNGYEQGHFRCLHAHCMARTDGDFIQALGYVVEQFDVVVAPTGQTEERPLPAFARDRQGRIEATVDNLYRALRHREMGGMDIRFDEFNDEIVHSSPGCGQWQPFSDQDYTRLRINLERRGFKPIGRELVRDVVLLVANENRFDTAVEWINTLTWDGKSRIEHFFSRYFGADDTPYSRAASLYMWTALAGRVMSPGVQADMAMVLIGHQGIGKTTGVKAIVPAADHFVEVRLDKRDEDTARELRGKLVGEIGELRGLMGRDSDDIKNWLSRTHEEWVPKYREFSTKFPRRLVFIGTTNREEFLVDETGNRRWLPVRVNKVNVGAITADRDQLWAEARDLFATSGVVYREAETLATEVHHEHIVKDAWLETVEEWLDKECLINGDIPRTREFLRTSDVLLEALNMQPKAITKREEMRIGNVLRVCGFVRETKRVDGRTMKVWVHKLPPVTT